MSSRVYAAWKRYINRLIAAEISTLARFYDSIIQWCPLAHDPGDLLERIQCPEKSRTRSGDDFDISAETQRRTLILLNSNLNHDSDIHDLLKRLHKKLSRSGRLVLVLFNPYLRWLYQAGNALGLRQAPLPTTFITGATLENLAEISGFSVCRHRQVVHAWIPLLGLDRVINFLFPLIPLLRRLSLCSVVVLRPLKSVHTRATRPSLSIIIPARNEKGNIEPALRDMPDIKDAEIEIVFVEGHSTDGTWQEILRVQEGYGGRFKIKALQQQGSGKSDAVRLGFANASGDLVTILDADLTMPPELLPHFYEIYVQGHGDFINGCRLVYPMEKESMAFLNYLGNIFFAKALSSILDIRIGDSLCGTKLLARHDYARMVRWREVFGEFDPFGDFELLFPAAVLALGVADLPIRYRARTYGYTKISRFRHGWILLKMVTIGLLRIRSGRVH